jgi:colanic acid biosynthesis glycosyl transferase WcaI
MHIVALNQFYAPDPSATSQLLTELAEGLVTRGHRVTVLAADEQGTERFVNGVHVIGIRATKLGKRSLLRRAMDYGSYYLGVLQALPRIGEADVYLPLTTPPLLSLVPEFVSLFTNRPVVALVQDLYPDVAVELGVLPRDGVAHRLWAEASRLSLKRATRIVALSESMAARIARYGVERHRVDVIPNWALGELERRQDAVTGGRARLEYGLGDRFVVMYSGNLGAGHAFETLCAAMKRLAHRNDIAFAIIGDGVRRHEVETFVRREKLDNVKLMPLAPRAFLAESLAAADLHLITMRDGLEGLIVPSKLYGILAAARPALFIGPRGDVVAETLRDAEAGMSCDHGDVDGVVEAIERMARDRARTRGLGLNGRAYLEAHFGRARAIDAYEETFERAVEEATGAKTSASRMRRRYTEAREVQR